MMVRKNRRIISVLLTLFLLLTAAVPSMRFTAGGTEMPPFYDEAVVDGVMISVSAGEGVFPADAALSVRKVSAQQEALAQAAVSEERPQDADVASSYTFDIKVLDAKGNELQPADGQTVGISFTAAEAAQEDLEPAVYHFSQDAQSGLTAERLTVAVCGETETVTAESGGFSLYHVEFTRRSNQASYIIMGSDPVLLSFIFRMTGLKGKIADSAPQFDPPEGFQAVQNGTDWELSYSGDGGDPDLSAVMTVRIGGTAYTFDLKTAATDGGNWINKEGQTMSWSYDAATKTLTLSGNGKLDKIGQADDFGLDKSFGDTDPNVWLPEVPWKTRMFEIENVVICEGVTSIGDQTFRNYTTLEHVTIQGNTLTEIGKCAFINCTALHTLDLSQCTSLTDIGQNAPANESPFINSGLTTILLSPALEELAPSLLHWNNSSLQYVNFSQLVNLVSIGEEALKKEDSSPEITDVNGGGLNLQSQTNLVTIGKNAFRNQTGLDSNLVIGSSALETIAAGAFSAYKAQYGVLESVDLSACTALRSIGAQAFLNQSHLTNIIFPDAVTYVYKNAFQGTGLQIAGTNLAYCVGGNGALYSYQAGGTAVRVLNNQDQSAPMYMSWFPDQAADVLRYNGAEQELAKAPDLFPQLSGYSIAYTVDGNPVSGTPAAKDVGMHTVEFTVSLPDGTRHSGSFEIKIIGGVLTQDMLSLDADSFEYDGNEKTPVLTVTASGNVLTEGKDYTVDTSSQTSATDVGSYTISVTGAGGFAPESVSIGWSISDTIPPVITGAENGAEYTQTVDLSVSDLRLDTVTLQKDTGEPENLTVTDGTAQASVSAAGTYTVTAKDLSGNETAISFKIRVQVSVEVSEGGTVTGAGVYDAGETVTLTAVPDEGYRFVSWTENGAEIGTDPTYTFTAGTNRTLTANFAEYVAGKLTISRNAAADQDYVYTVTDQAEQAIAQVVIRKGQTSITISGVEFGTYNVTEETSWSWRSTPQERIQQAVLDSEEGVTVTFAENTQARRTEWLSYEKSRVKVYTPGA